MKTAFLSALLLSASAYAGDTFTGASQSIEEWPQAKWGMTEPQVLQAFEGAARKLPSPQPSPEFNGRVGTVAIDDVAVGGVSLHALFLFDRAGMLDGISLASPDAIFPTVEEFRKIEDSLTHKYREPVRSAGGSRFLSVWTLSRSVVELDYDRPVSLSVRFESKSWHTPETITQGLTVVHGRHVFADPLALPVWLAPFPHERDSQSTAAVNHLHVGYDTNGQFGVVAGHYETVLHEASRSGVTFSEEAGGGGVSFRASQGRTSCTVQISNRAVHVDVDCVLSPEPPLAPTVAVAATVAGQTDFRQARWGMSRREVIATETKRLTPTQDDSLVGEDTIDGLRLVFGYTFVDGKLGRAGYILMEKYVEPNQYLLATDRLVKSLTEKYGPPQNKSEWRNMLYSGDPLKYGFAISAGHLIVRNYWETDRTKIFQFTSGENFQVTLGIQYTGKAFESAFEEKDRDARMKAF